MNRPGVTYAGKVLPLVVHTAMEDRSGSLYNLHAQPIEPIARSPSLTYLDAWKRFNKSIGADGWPAASGLRAPDRIRAGHGPASLAIADERFDDTL